MSDLRPADPDDANESPVGPDVRFLLANERTLLAWLRTGLTVMALGFVVARFGLFLRLLSLQTQAASASVNGAASPFSLMKAFGDWPRYSSWMPMTLTSSTAGCS